MSTCTFSLTNKGIGLNKANFYYLASGGATQSVASGATVKFNNIEASNGFGWNGSNTITILQTGTYRIIIAINYGYINNNVEFGLLVNGVLISGVFGQFIPLATGVGQIFGEWSVPLGAGDTIKIVNTSNAVVIKQAGTNDERVANLSISNI